MTKPPPLPAGPPPGPPDPSGSTEKQGLLIGKEPPSGRKFPCLKCGARLDFDPRSRALKCPYCGHVEKIERGQAGVVERDLEEYLSRETGESTVEGRRQEVKCQTCAAVVLLEDKVAADRCPYCGTFLENKAEAAKAMHQPEGLLPFAIDRRKAGDAFRTWVGGLWFAPTELKEWADRGQINGAYIPFWTYDSMTYTFYTGQRGDDYQETEHFTDTEYYTEDGETKSREVMKTRTVTKTNWVPVSGEVQHFFDDVLVCGTKSLPERYTNTVKPKELEGLEEFKPELLSGFTTERYTVGPKEGFDKAKEIMDGHIRVLCCQDIGGDHQQLHTVETQHIGVTFKHVLLPVWLTSYRYRDKSYRVLINGQTGEVLGDRPYSFWKIFALVLVILLVVAAIVFAAVKLANRKPGRAESGPPAAAYRQAAQGRAAISLSRVRAIL
jgi:DNA-directed RNA polymerase subunit RPC12/RpoP